MKAILKLAFFCLSSSLLVGCGPSHQKMQSRFNDRQPLVVDAEFYNKYIRFVHLIARKFVGQVQGNPRLDYDDLVQAGTMGLMEAAKRFDPEKGSFLTIGTWYVKKAIRDAIIESAPINAGRGPTSRAWSIPRFAAKFEKLHGREPTKEEIAKHLGFTVKAVEEYSRLTRDVLSLQADRSQKSNDSLNMMMLLTAEDSGYFEALNKVEESSILNSLEVLSKRQRQVVYLYYWENLKIEQIAERFGVSRQRIQQNLQESRLKLRTVLSSHRPNL